MKILIDNGHGIDTKGKRSPDGRLLEYAQNRLLAGRIVQDRSDVNPFLPGFLEHSQQVVRLRNVDLLHQYGDIASRQQKRIKLSHRPRGL